MVGGKQCCECRRAPQAAAASATATAGRCGRNLSNGSGTPASGEMPACTHAQQVAVFLWGGWGEHAVVGRPPSYRPRPSPARLRPLTTPNWRAIFSTSASSSRRRANMALTRPTRLKSCGWVGTRRMAGEGDKGIQGEPRHGHAHLLDTHTHTHTHTLAHSHTRARARTHTHMTYVTSEGPYLLCVQLGLAHAQAQQVALGHVALHDLDKQVVQGLPRTHSTHSTARTAKQSTAHGLGTHVSRALPDWQPVCGGRGNSKQALPR